MSKADSDRKNVAKAREKKAQIKAATGKGVGGSIDGMRKDFAVHAIKQAMVQYCGGPVEYAKKMLKERPNNFDACFKALIPKQIEVGSDPDRPVRMVVEWKQPDKAESDGNAAG